MSTEDEFNQAVAASKERALHPLEPLTGPDEVVEALNALALTHHPEDKKAKTLVVNVEDQLSREEQKNLNRTWSTL